MKIWRFILIFIIVVFLGLGIYDLFKERSSLRNDVDGLSAKVGELKLENEKLAGDIEYFKSPENLVKELKSQFNYRLSDEKMLIIVPNGTGTRP